MTVEPHDPLLAALAELTAPATTPALDTRVRARCHAALADRCGPRTARPLPARGRRLVDRALAIAVAVYGLVTVAEALRMITRSLP